MLTTVSVKGGGGIRLRLNHKNEKECEILPRATVKDTLAFDTYNEKQNWFPSKQDSSIIVNVGNRIV